VHLQSWDGSPPTNNRNREDYHADTTTAGCYATPSMQAVLDIVALSLIVKRIISLPDQSIVKT